MGLLHYQRVHSMTRDLRVCNHVRFSKYLRTNKMRRTNRQVVKTQAGVLKGLRIRTIGQMQKKCLSNK